MTKKRGAYVTFNGPEASGKSTLIERMRSEMPEVLFTREPGGSRISDHIRALLLNPEFTEMTPEAEVLLFMANRAQNIRQIVIPAIESGQSVVSDRNYLSSEALQAYGHGLFAIIDLQPLIHFSAGVCPPDMQVIIDVPYEVSLQRMSLSSRNLDRLEALGEDFHNRVRNGFLEIARDRNLPVIDGTGTTEDVYSKVLRHCGELLLKGVEVK